MVLAENIYLKQSDLINMTGDMTFVNVKSIYYEGSFYKDVKELYIEGNNLIVITNNNNYKIIITDYVKNPFRIIRTEEEDLIDLIETGLIKNSENLTVPLQGNTVKGTIFSDTIILTEYEPPINVKKLNVKSDWISSAKTDITASLYTSIDNNTPSDIQLYTSV